MTASRPNILSIDVEDYWSIFSRDWLKQDASCSNAVEKNTHWFLEVLDEYKTKATFFTLCEVAREFPSLIRQIAAAGHEIASHGSSHRQLFKMTPREFKSELHECRSLLADTISAPIHGFRAPAFSIIPKTRWALDILAQQGFEYDSSIYPISGSRYGWPGFCRDICTIPLPDNRRIIEVPMSSLTILGKSLPIAGGGYLRHFPYLITKCAIRRIQKTRPVVVYMHPYEIDTEDRSFDTSPLPSEQKRKALSFHRAQLRNRSTVAAKLKHLLSDFDFTTVAGAIDAAMHKSLPVFDIEHA